MALNCSLSLSPVTTTNKSKEREGGREREGERGRRVREIIDYKEEGG